MLQQLEDGSLATCSSDTSELMKGNDLPLYGDTEVAQLDPLIAVVITLPGLSIFADPVYKPHQLLEKVSETPEAVEWDPYRCLSAQAGGLGIHRFMHGATRHKLASSCSTSKR